MVQNNSDMDVLLIKHLPSSLTLLDREDLLKHFGASKVHCIYGTKGPLKYSAFAKFESNKLAWQALKRLHQLSVLGSTLCVEFSKKKFEDIQEKTTDPVTSVKSKLELLSTGKDSKNQDSDKVIVHPEAPDKVKVQDSIDSISEKFSLRYLFNSKLRYSYPPPSVGIITNIANALVSVPKFYVQVLHLMNKMNLSAPFGVVREMPPMPEEPPPLPSEEKPPLPEEPDDMEVSSTEESELESASDGEGAKKVPLTTPAESALKRKLKEKRKQPKKKLKLQNVLLPPVVKNQPVIRPEEVFEQPNIQGAKKVGFKFGQLGGAALSSNQSAQNISELILEQGELVEDTDVVPIPQPVPPENPTNTSIIDEQQLESTLVKEGGFGKMEPAPKNLEGDSSNEEGEEEEWGAGKFISSRRLRHGQLSQREMRDYPVFKTYQPGEPTTRLYVKNLAKQTTDKDLHYIFGRYVDWDNDVEKNMFDIRLMKEGRMKGQCFITLGNEDKAKEALKNINTYVLKGKPMVVQFARSAKPKPAEEKSKK